MVQANITEGLLRRIVITEVGILYNSILLYLLTSLLFIIVAGQIKQILLFQGSVSDHSYCTCNRPSQLSALKPSKIRISESTSLAFLFYCML